MASGLGSIGDAYTQQMQAEQERKDKAEERRLKELALHKGMVESKYVPDALRNAAASAYVNATKLGVDVPEQGFAFPDSQSNGTLPFGTVEAYATRHYPGFAQMPLDEKNKVMAEARQALGGTYTLQPGADPQSGNLRVLATKSGEIQETGRGRGTSNQLKTLPASEVKDLATFQRRIDGVKELRALASKHLDKIGLIDNLIAEMKSYTVGDPNYESLRRQVKQQFDVMYALTGAAFNAGELATAKESFMSNLSAPDANFMAGLDEIEKWLVGTKLTRERMYKKFAYYVPDMQPQTQAAPAAPQAQVPPAAAQAPQQQWTPDKAARLQELLRKAGR